MSSMQLLILLLITIVNVSYGNEIIEVSSEGDPLIYNNNIKKDENNNNNAIPKSHALFLLNYATINDDNSFNIWDHAVLEHWDRKISNRYPRGITYRPPDDLPTRYYPLKGAYSSSNEKTIELQVNEAKLANIELLVVPFTITKEEGEALSPYITSDLHKKIYTDQNLPLLLQYAHKANIKIGFMIEKYLGRTEQKVFEQIKYLLTTYKAYKSFFPIFYIYDAHELNMKQILSKTESYEPVSVRKLYHKMMTESLKTSNNNIVEESDIQNNNIEGQLHERIYVISSWVHPDSGTKAYEDGYDGVFTYFATDKHSYGSNISNWKIMNEFSNNNNMLFIPSISPGYDDLKIRPWNEAMVVKRFETTKKTNNNDGEKEFYYNKRCANVKTELTEYPPKILFINSFNDFVHGTQIEPATPVNIPSLEACDPQRKGNRMCKRLQKMLNIDGTYLGYLGEETSDDYATAIRTGGSEGIEYNENDLTNNILESSAFHYLKLTKKCIEKVLG